MSFFSKPRTIRVYPNPYAATDHNGRPSGAFQHEPSKNQTDTHVRHVGAARVTEKVKDAVVIGGFEAEQEVHDNAHDFAPEVVEVPNTDHYHRAIRSGELVAADKTAFAQAGCDMRLYREPEEILAEAKLGAAELQIAHYGEVAPALLDHWSEWHETNEPKLKAIAEQRAAAAKQAADAAALADDETKKGESEAPKGKGPTDEKPLLLEAQHADGPTGLLPSLPRSAYPDNAVPLRPPTTETTPAQGSADAEAPPELSPTKSRRSIPSPAKKE